MVDNKDNAILTLNHNNTLSEKVSRQCSSSVTDFRNSFKGKLSGKWEIRD